MELSIIVINNDTPKVTKNAIDSLIKTIKDVDFEVIVIDNSAYSSNKLIYSNERVFVVGDVVNNGFGNACNIGASYAKGEVLLFLNSDTIVFENTIDKAFSFFKKQKNVGTMGVRQLLRNGKLDAGCKRGFPTPLNSLYYFSGLSKLFPKSKRFGAYQQTFVDEHSVADVDCISGAFMLILKDVFQYIGGFDEDYFLYGEDVDLCYRLKKAGFNNMYYGKVSFLHYKNETSKNSLKALESFYESMQIFYNKHYKNKYFFVVDWLVKIAVRLKLWLAKRRFNKVREKND